MDPAREGVCVARSVHSEEESERLTKRFWAQSIMQGAPETLNMMGGLTSLSIVWSKDRPAGWPDMDVSAITCREMSSPSCYEASCPQVKTVATRGGWSYSWWLDSCVNRSVWDIFGLHDTENTPNNLICWEQNNLQLDVQNVMNNTMKHHTQMLQYLKTFSTWTVKHIPLARRTSLQDLCALRSRKQRSFLLR